MEWSWEAGRVLEGFTKIEARAAEEEETIKAENKVKKHLCEAV